VVKQDKLCGRRYRARKTVETFFRNGLLHIDGDDWRRLLKIVSSVLHINILEMFVESFAKHRDILANMLKIPPDGITEHDIAPYLNRCALDITVQTSSSLDINAQNGNHESTLNNITTILDTAAMRFLKPWLFIEWIFRATELGKKYYKAVQSVHGKIITEIGEKKGMRETTFKRRVKRNLHY
jgi:hypothetical protein